MLTVKEAAELLRVNTKTVYALIAAGKLGFVRIGRVIRIPRSILDQLCRVVTEDRHGTF
jgi:excisionase family DNA binding protein